MRTYAPIVMNGDAFSEIIIQSIRLAAFFFTAGRAAFFFTAGFLAAFAFGLVSFFAVAIIFQ